MIMLTRTLIALFAATALIGAASPSERKEIASAKDIVSAELTEKPANTTPTTTTTIATTTTTAPPVTQPPTPPETTVVEPPESTNIGLAGLVVLPFRGAERMCPQYHELAVEIGWPVEELPKLSYVMWRESRCQPSAHNESDPTSEGSRGIMQINGFWCLRNSYTPNGFLQDNGVLSTCEELHDPEIALRAALEIWEYGVERYGYGWRPWAV